MKNGRIFYLEKLFLTQYTSLIFLLIYHQDIKVLMLFSWKESKESQRNGY